MPDYDFPLFVNYARLAQIVCLTSQILILYSESDRIGYFSLLLPLISNGIHLMNVTRRWHGSIDGRFDLQQLLSVKHNTLRVQYAIAVLTSPLCAFITTWFMPLEEAAFLSSLFYSLFSYVKFLAAEGVLGLEVMEVSKEKMQKTN